MNCPKCGQELININGREICTNCGVIEGKANLNQQIDQQIKDKVVLAEPPEEYVSPTEYNLQKSQEVKSLTVDQSDTPISELKETAPPIAEDLAGDSKIPDFPDQNQPPVTIEEETISAVSGSVQRVEEVSVPVRVAPEGDLHSQTEPETAIETSSSERSQMEENPVVSAQSQSELIPVPIQTNQGPKIEVNPDEKIVPVREEFSQEVHAKNDLLKKIINANPPKPETEEDSSKLKIEPFPTNFQASEGESKPVYRSHELNPGFFKFFIIIAVIVIVFGVIGYLALNVDHVKEFINQIVIYSGERLFQ